MEELLEILEEMKPGIDFKSEKHLIDDKVFDSLAIMALVAKLSDEFDVEITPLMICFCRNRYRMITGKTVSIRPAITAP